MIKKWSFYTSLTLIIAYLSSGFKPFELHNHNWFQVNQKDELSYLFPSQEQKDYTNLNVPFTGKFFIGFKEASLSKNRKENTIKSTRWVIWENTNLVSETLKTIGIHDSLLF
jgi:hypothetical protein